MPRGFTLLELIVVVAILGILFSIVIVGFYKARVDAFNARIKNDIRQLRVLAESAYDSTAASYFNWSTNGSVSAEVQTIAADVADAHNSPTALQIRDQEVKEFCVSAPLHSSLGTFYCVDASGVLKESATACPAVAPFVCP